MSQESDTTHPYADHGKANQARCWVGTIHADSDEEVMDKYVTWSNILKAGKLKENVIIYGIVAIEKGKTQGRLHLQFYIHFSKPIRLGALQAVCSGYYCQKSAYSTDKDNQVYCSKDKDKPWSAITEYGNPEITEEKKKSAREKGGEKMAAKYKAAFDLAKEGKFDVIEPMMLIRHAGNLEKIQFMCRKPPRNLMDYNFVDENNLPVEDVNYHFIWIYGKPRVGKTTFVKELVNTVWGEDLYYNKDMTKKWWNGYVDQPFASLEDFTAGDQGIWGGAIKTWFDSIPFDVEPKNAQFKARPVMMVVTSNYKIRDFTWGKNGDEMFQEAMISRFTEVEAFKKPHFYVEGNDLLDYCDAERDEIQNFMLWEQSKEQIILRAKNLKKQWEAKQEIWRMEREQRAKETEGNVGNETIGEDGELGEDLNTDDDDLGSAIDNSGEFEEDSSSNDELSSHGSSIDDYPTQYKYWEHKKDNKRLRALAELADSQLPTQILPVNITQVDDEDEM